MIHEADIIAIRRAYSAAGKDAALVELRHRFMHVSEHAAPGVLVKVLKLPVSMPLACAEQGRPVMDNRRRAMRG